MKTLLLPIGISFYTLQAIGYMADVYWEKIPAQRHLGKLALFLGFFPQIMEGPISMYEQTGEDLWKGEDLRGENLSAGWSRILWGLFKKMIVADRLYVLVKAVFEHYQDYSGSIVVFAAIAYTLQLYMEFSGCMDIVIGSGRLFGVRLPENFCRPFASKNAAEFWRRWHITLGAWLKTYVFYPVSVSRMVKKWNRFGKKHLGKYLTRLGATAMCLFPVWLCNGLWHGPSWHYIFYGRAFLPGKRPEGGNDHVFQYFPGLQTLCPVGWDPSGFQPGQRGLYGDICRASSCGGNRNHKRKESAEGKRPSGYEHTSPVGGILRPDSVGPYIRRLRDRLSAGGSDLCGILRKIKVNGEEYFCSF